MKTYLLWLTAGAALGYLAAHSLNEMEPWKWAYIKGATAKSA